MSDMSPEVEAVFEEAQEITDGLFGETKDGVRQPVTDEPDIAALQTKDVDELTPAELIAVVEAQKTQRAESPAGKQRAQDAADIAEARAAREQDAAFLQEEQQADDYYDVYMAVGDPNLGILDDYRNLTPGGFRVLDHAHDERGLMDMEEWASILSPEQLAQWQAHRKQRATEELDAVMTAAYGGVDAELARLAAIPVLDNAALTPHAYQLADAFLNDGYPDPETGELIRLDLAGQPEAVGKAFGQAMFKFADRLADEDRAAESRLLGHITSAFSDSEGNSRVDLSTERGKQDAKEQFSELMTDLSHGAADRRTFGSPERQAATFSRIVSDLEPRTVSPLSLLASLSPEKLTPQEALSTNDPDVIAASSEAIAHDAAAQAARLTGMKIEVDSPSVFGQEAAIRAAQIASAEHGLDVELDVPSMPDSLRPKAHAVNQRVGRARRSMTPDEIASVWQKTQREVRETEVRAATKAARRGQ